MTSFNNIALIAVFLSVALSGVTAWDKDIKIHNLAGCRELRLDSQNNNQLTVPILGGMANNKALTMNERLRMKFYVIGYHVQIYFKTSMSSSYEFLAYINANVNGKDKWRTTLQSFLPNKKDIQTVESKHLTHLIHYAELTLVISTSKYFKLSVHCFLLYNYLFFR